MEVAKRLDGIGEYYFSQKLREIDNLNKQGKQVINLGIGSPDRPPHPNVIKELNEQSLLPTVHAYQSYKGSSQLRNAISTWYKKSYNVTLDPESEILPLIGSKEGIVHLCMTFLNEGDAVLVPNPGYPTYRSAVMLAGAGIIEYNLVEEKNWFPDFDELGKTVRAHGKIKLMFVNYPHMPTGKLPTRDLFKQIVNFGREYGILIVHDNPYSFILNEEPMSLLEADEEKEVVIELNSLSKSHNMAGWRVGMLVGAKERVDQVLRFKSNMDSGMFLPVQLAAAKALTLGKEWNNEVNNVYQKRRQKVFSLLDILHCTYDIRQGGLFVWAAIPDAYKDGYDLSDEVLYNAGVFITPGGIFGDAGRRYVRVSLCANEEKIDEAIKRVAQNITVGLRMGNEINSVHKNGIKGR
ncbi:MAG TPA: aminotransferase class I/II-fold pyridoxal phosphate-dependent enzyme [Chitinophagaceae bacterium]|nr:aminotransferase class I/II-fold pyridoxal phosphate-dependent enzyme [Chitinophagaceae bacterium]